MKIKKDLILSSVDEKINRVNTNCGYEPQRSKLLSSQTFVTKAHHMYLWNPLDSRKTKN